MDLQFVLSELYERFVTILLGPVNHPESLWILIPIVVGIILMELYFGRYKEEELGWNTAFGNSLILLFVSMDLLRYFYNSSLGVDISNLRVSLVVSLMVIGFMLGVLTYFHLLPKNFAFVVSGKLPLNLLSYLAVIMVYTNIMLDWYTAVSSLIFCILFAELVRFIWFLIPESYEE